MSNIFWGIVGSLLGALVVLLIKEVLSYLKSRKGVFTGEWDQIIPAQQGEPAKHDLVHCQHIGRNIEGKIERLQPKEQRYKNWRFQGQVRSQVLFVTFWTTNEAKNPGSYGTIQLNIITETQLSGFYVKLIVAALEERFTGQLKKFQLEWVRRRAQRRS